MYKIVEKLKYILLINFILFFLCISVYANNDNLKKVMFITIEIKIIDYKYGALHSFFEGSFDATICKIIRPVKFADKELIIFHKKTLKEDSPWKNVGGEYIVDIISEFEEYDHIFSGAVKNMKLLKKDRQDGQS